MKARIKATGEIVEVTFSHIIHNNGHDIIWYNTSQGAYFSNEEIKFIDTGDSLDYWTRLEHQYAGMAMQGMLSGWWSENIAKVVKCDGEHFDVLTHKANEIAHALVQKLKEKEVK